MQYVGILITLKLLTFGFLTLKLQQRCDESLRVRLSIEPLHLRPLKINIMIYSPQTSHFVAIFS